MPHGRPSRAGNTHPALCRRSQHGGALAISGIAKLLRVAQRKQTVMLGIFGNAGNF
jgi:hypothetical protein